MRKILLTFDVEEFDLPLEYGISISKEEQMVTGKRGLDALTEILEDKEIACTLFTTANFALKFPSEIASLSAKHEIASHTFFHSSFEEKDLKESRQALENIIFKKVTGLRMPRMKQISAEWVKQAGYEYDSSLNPTWLPGRYNHLSKPRKLYSESGIFRVPVSVSANLRIPLFWLAFKNFPYSYFKIIALQTLRKDGYLSLYFHPWEFTDLSKYKIPAITKRKSGIQLVNQLKRLIADFKEEGEFITMNSFLETRSPVNS
jgi:peptidoglycan/xylan/chitin deacetylase (PgdA/CDA1 family)